MRKLMNYKGPMMKASQVLLCFLKLYMLMMKTTMTVTTVSAWNVQVSRWSHAMMIRKMNRH